MKRAMMAMTFLLSFFLLTGCDEDQRNDREKKEAPKPELSTRKVMACPQCGAPQAPYRLTHIKSYYKCEGQPPKFKYHEAKEWSHRISDPGKPASAER
jgi:hypothetical protein